MWLRVKSSTRRKSPRSLVMKSTISMSHFPTLKKLEDITPNYLFEGTFGVKDAEDDHKAKFSAGEDI